MARRATGTNSAASAAALGIAPPSPMPATSLSVASAPTLPAVETASVAPPKITMQPRSALRRPNRSPASPATAPPIIMPRYPSATIGAKALRGTCQSAMIDGMVTPSIWLSMPSKTTVSAVRKTSHRW